MTAKTKTVMKPEVVTGFETYALNRRSSNEYGSKDMKKRTVFHPVLLAKLYETYEAGLII